MYIRYVYLCIIESSLRNLKMWGVNMRNSDNLNQTPWSFELQMSGFSTTQLTQLWDQSCVKIQVQTSNFETTLW